jgi:hypothetical protein
LENIGKVRTLPPEKTDTAPPTTEKEKAKQHRQYAKYVVRPFKAMGRGIIAVVNWTDKNNGFVTALATVFIAALTGVYVHYSRAQWKVMRDQLPELHTSAEAAKSAAKAAEGANTTAHDALVRSTRPWVGPFGDPKLLGTPIIDKAGNVSLSVEVPVKNFGTSPALNVEFQVLPDIPQIGPENYRMKFINDTCKEAVSAGRGIIFPGSETTYTSSGSSHLPELKGRPWFTLEGCVVYTDQFQERTHHTRFCFVIPYLNKFPVHECGTTAD